MCTYNITFKYVYVNSCSAAMAMINLGMASINWWYGVCTERKVAVVTTVVKVPSLKGTNTMDS